MRNQSSMYAQVIRVSPQTAVLLTAVVTWTPPTATDNFGVPTLTSTPNSGDTFPIGNNTVTYTATDDGRKYRNMHLLCNCR